jgi:hypothetical protein
MSVGGASAAGGAGASASAGASTTATTTASSTTATTTAGTTGTTTASSTTSQTGKTGRASATANGSAVTAQTDSSDGPAVAGNPAALGQRSITVEGSVISSLPADQRELAAQFNAAIEAAKQKMAQQSFPVLAAPPTDVQAQVTLAQYAPTVPGMPFAPPVPPLAIPGTPENKGFTESTVKALDHLAETSKKPADLDTVGRRLDYLGDQLAQGHIGTVLGHTILGTPFPSAVDFPNVVMSEKAEPVPERDETGKVHGALPDRVPDNWTDEDLEQAAEDLRHSIGVREQEQLRLGEDGPHRNRIEQERDLLRQIEKKRSGS